MGDNHVSSQETVTTTTGSKRRSARRVSWAPENNLCQVRLFLAEDAPFQAGQIEQQDQLQAKKPVSLCAGQSPHSFDLPPGFEKGVPIPQKQELDNISPQTTWRCPPRVCLNSNGDEFAQLSVIWMLIKDVESRKFQILDHRICYK
eukprot:TRINITY_DN3753_c0_g1_i5.p1 TRINITY_DN3753_c0_g1~~TRINITY_DN3753_c0_g1_i5.p1  ORF type:complete len:146 (+),score=16.63 TRINITY_DN3753_c0_g1_i5:830-1267(+)